MFNSEDILRPASTLRGVIIVSDRRAGNTTRIVDNAIQLLFEGECIRCEDHHNTRKSHCDLFVLVERRMNLEHPRVKLQMDSQKLLMKIKRDGWPDYYFEW